MNRGLEDEIAVRALKALDHLVAARAELIDVQELGSAAPAVADMLRGVNEALAAHLTAELRQQNT